MSATAESLQSQTRISRQPSVPKICRFCSKGFTKTEHLHRHTRSHTKERPFRCDDCGKSYSRHDTLLRHRKGHKHTKIGQNTTDSDNRASISGPCDPDEAVAPTPINIQSMEGYTMSTNDPATSLSVGDDVGHHSFEPLQIDPNLDHPMPLNANNGVDIGSMESVIQGQSIPQLSRNFPGVDFEFSPPAMGSWGMHEESFGSWQISDDFDLESFNTSLLLPNVLEQTGWQAPPAVDKATSPTISVEEPRILTVSDMADVQSLWITKTLNNFWKNDGNASYSVGPSRPLTPTTDHSPATTVDDSYRNALTRRLRTRWKELALPSTEFLNSALQLFFTKFNPIFPILHEPTFRASNHNSLLLLSMCSIGSLFMGSSAATAHGARIFERLNKVILASWEGIMHKPTPERLCMVQAAVIGQTFAYLSGEPKYLATVDAFHGTVIAFARRCGLFNANHQVPQVEDQTPEGLEQVWNDWARSEEMTRAALGVYIHDAQIATTFHHDPILRHDAIRVSGAAANDLFVASTAARWRSLLQDRSSTPGKLSTHLHVAQPQHACNRPLSTELACKNSRFSCYVLLHGIGAAVQECNAAGSLSIANRVKFTDALICWYHAYEKSRPANEVDPFSLMVLCHEIFMQLLVKFDELEKAIGRDGPEAAVDALQYVRLWSSTTEATRCVVHASLILRQVGSMRIDAEPALHVPRSIFLAALVWYCYIQFEQGESETPQDTQMPLDIIEVSLFNINPFQYPIETSVLKKGKSTLTESSPLGGLIDTLLRIGHWGISSRLARILRLLVDGGGFQHLGEQ